jgi:hypothetical protein
VKWNEVLLTNALPELWMEALVEMTCEVSARSSEGVVRFLPNLNDTLPDWMSCAEELYKFVATKAVLPHIHGDTTEWVRPNSAAVLEDAPTTAFDDLRDDMMSKYVDRHFAISEWPHAVSNIPQSW